MQVFYYFYVFFSQHDLGKVIKLTADS